MQYLLIIYNNERNWTTLSEADAGALMGEYMAFTESVARSGHYKGGNALQPTNTARTMRLRDGASSATEGPYAETREQMGGYYLIEAADMDEASAIALRIPAARTGGIEIRPIMPTPAPTPATA